MAFNILTVSLSSGSQGAASSSHAMTHPSTLFEPADSSSSVHKLTHNPVSAWRSYVFMHVLLRAAIWLRNRAARKAGSGKLHPTGPQDFSKLLGAYEKGKNKYARQHCVRLDWCTPASEPKLFGSSHPFDWSAIRVLRFQPKAGSTNAQRSIVYLNGGGFVQPAMTAHSYMCSLLAHRLNAVVYMFPYELAPAGIAASELPRLTAFYLAVSAHARDLGHEVFVAGDSAGGSIASSMPLCIQRFAPLLLGKPTMSTEEIVKLLPDQLILLAPVTTCNVTGEIEKPMDRVQAQDWWLDRKRVQELCQMWVGTTSVQEAAVQQLASASNVTENAAEKWRQVLPLRADDDMLGPIASPTTFELLQQAKVHVTLSCGTSDILYACAYHFAKRCEQHKVECTFIEGEGGVHVYPILGFVLSDPGCIKGSDLVVQSVLKASRFE